MTELPPERRVDREIERDSDVELRELSKKLGKGLAEVSGAMTRQSKAMDAALRDLDFQTNLKPLLAVQDRFIVDLGGKVAEVTAELKSFNSTAAEVYKVIKAESDDDTVDIWSRRNFKLSVFVGVVTGIAGLATLGSLITAIVAAVRSSTPPQPTGDPSIGEKLKELYRCIKNTTDEEFWNQVMAFVIMERGWTLYLADQLAMMNYVTDWFPFLGEWVWASGDDKTARIKQLIDAYEKTGIGAVYTTVGKMTYAGDPTRQGAVKLPRSIAADLIRIALAQIIAAANGITD